MPAVRRHSELMLVRDLYEALPECVLVGDYSVWFATSHGLGRIDREMVRRIQQIKQERKQSP